MKISLFPYFIIEAICIVLYVAKFGFLNFIGEAFLSAFIGAWILTKFGFVSFYGRISSFGFSDIFGSFGFAIGGFFLMIPGVLCDILGVFILVISLFAKFGVNSDVNSHQDKNTSNDDVIDVEIVEEKK